MGLESVIQSDSLHELNKGKNLNLFGKQKTMKIGFVVNKIATEIKIFKAIDMVLNTKYNAKLVCVTTSTGQEKTILGNHFRYIIRESKHSELNYFYSFSIESK